MSYLSLISDRDPRRADILPLHTVIHSEEGIFTIEDQPVHSGGHGLLYYVHKEGTEIDYVLKEYFPAKGYSRKNGIVVPTAFGDVSSDSMDVLKSVEDDIEESVNTEERNSQLIYRHTSRVAVNRTALHVSSVTYPDGTSFTVPAGMTNPWHFLLIDDLTQKGAFLTDIIREAVYEKSDDHPFGNYTPRRSLGKTLPVLDIHITLKIISSVLELLSRIHERAGYIHGDIQPNNIFFEGADLKKGIVGHAVFLDFGSSHKLQDNNTTELLLPTEVTGTPAFAPPELYNEDSISLSPAADLYSVGRLFLSLIKPKTAISSFGSVASPCLSYNQLRIKPGEERASHCSPTLLKGINAILKKALEQDPDCRYQSAREMLTAIEALSPHYRLPEGLSTPEFFIEHSRDAELDRLESALESGMKPVWIWGFGGIGKTELAMEFGRRCKQKNYTVSVFRFHDSIQQTILDLQISDYQFRAPEGLNECELPHAQFEDRLRVLNSMGPDTVLIMDNFDLESARYSEMLASPDFKMLCDISPKLVITTRYNLFQRYPQFEVQPLEPQMLLQLFDQGLQVSNDVLLDIIHAVGCHTMTVALIAKAMNDILSPMDPEGLLRALKNSDISKVPDAIVTDKDRSYQEKTIYEHLKIVFNLSQLSDDEKTVLKYSMLIGFAPDPGLDLALFLALLSPQEKDAFRRLIDHGWISCTKERFLRVHPLIKELCERELCPIESDFTEFVKRLRLSQAVHLLGDFSRYGRSLVFFRAFFRYSWHAHWSTPLVWSELSTVWMAYHTLTRAKGGYMLFKSNNMLNWKELNSYIDKYDLIKPVKNEPILYAWLLEYASPHVNVTLAMAESIYDGAYEEGKLFHSKLEDSIKDKELALTLLRQHSTGEVSPLISTLILHELAICYALDTKLYSQEKIIEGFQAIIDDLLGKEQENKNHDYLILLSYEYFNFAHYLAQQESPALNLQAKAYYTRALNLLLHIDDTIPYHSFAPIADIRNEFDFYLRNGYVNRGCYDYQRPEIQEEIEKLSKPDYEFPEPEDYTLSDWFEYLRIFFEHDRKEELIQLNDTLKFLVDSHASNYLIMKQKDRIEIAQEVLKRGFVTKEEDPEFCEYIEKRRSKYEGEIPFIL